MASENHNKKPLVIERRRGKERKKTPRLTKTYEVKIIPATIGVVMETEEPPKKRVAAYCRVSTDQEAQETSLEEQMAHFNTVIAEHSDWELAGIYADEGISGTQVKHRVQFQQMIEDAKAKKIDLILTKSISRFARNVVDCLTNIRLLRNLRPPVSVYFDKERLDSLDEKAEVFLTMLASFAQEESRSISTNIKWATRSRMKAGTQKVGTTSLLGYDTDDNGEMVIVTNEAEVVRTIYMSFEKGMHPTEIAEKLNALEIKTIKNNPWSSEAVKNILRNEKYCGDVLMQKTYTVDCLTHKSKKNEGEVEQYFIPDHHPAIVDREIWEKAQVRLEQIAGKRRRLRPKQQRLIPLRKGILLGFVPIKPTWKSVSFKRLETATEKVMELVGTPSEQKQLEEYESEECKVAILGKPNLLYVKDLYAGLSQSNYWKYENQTSGGLKTELSGVWKSNGSKTDINNTDSSETDLIYSAPYVENTAKEMREDERYRLYFQDKLEIPILEKNFPHDREILMEILELLVETVTSRKKFLRICGEEKPKEVVKSRLMKLDSMHIQYVMECLKSNTTQVRNIKQYLLATLYNAPTTIDSYYAAQVRHDFGWGGRSN